MMESMTTVAAQLQCQKCAAPFALLPGQRKSRRYCSQVCRNLARADYYSRYNAKRHPERDDLTCGECGAAFRGHYPRSARYCSDECRGRAKRRRRAARLAAHECANVGCHNPQAQAGLCNMHHLQRRRSTRRRYIFERDGWRCQLCGRAVRRDASWPHPKAPVVDHVIPRAMGGGDEPSNLQCAHNVCNAVKSDGVFGHAEQLRLIA